MSAAAPAAAHTPKIDATCTALTVDLKNYAATVPGTPAVTQQVVDVPGKPATETTYKTVVITPAGPDTAEVTEQVVDVLGKPATETTYKTVVITPAVPEKTNTVTVYIDGAIVADTTFSTSFVNTYAFTPKSTAHTWRVVVDGWDGWDVDKSGKTTPCVTPTVPTFTAGQCAVAGGKGSYTIPATAGINYKVSINNGAWSTKSANTYVVNIGTKVEVRAYALNDFSITGQDAWEYHFLAPDCRVTPNPATFQQAQCTGPGTYGQASYTIPSTTGVYYKVSINDGSWTVKTANTYVVSVGTKVEVEAFALDGYDLKGTDGWSHTFRAPYCEVNVTPNPATFQQAQCTGPGTYGQASYTIPSTTGVYYKVSINDGSWTVKTANTYFVNVGTKVEVEAFAQSYYNLTGTDGWVHTFVAPQCVVDVTPKPATFEQAQCTGPGTYGQASYTIPSTTGVYYKVSINDGSWNTAVADTYFVSAGTKVEVKAFAQNHYTLTGTGEWEQTFVTPICVVDVTAKPATFDQAQCTGPGTFGQASYTIPSTTGVYYKVSINDGSWNTAVADTYFVSAGTKVEVEAHAENHYLVEGVTEWEETFLVPNCVLDAPVVEPTTEDQTCTPPSGALVSGFLTIDNTPHVKYYIGTSVIPAVPGDIAMAPGIYSVRAEADPGYALTGYTEPWTKEIKAATPCGELPTEPEVEPFATMVQATCTSAGTFTLSNVLNNPSAVIWTVNNAVFAEGNYTAAAGTVKISAAPGVGFGFAADRQTEWVFTFAAPGDCQLETLAFTGSSPAAGALAGGAMGGSLLLLGLAAMLFVRRRQTVRTAA